MTVRLILGDQLNSNHSWFDVVDDDVIYFMAEMRQETDYVVHHIQKVVGFFAAMRHFSETQQIKGHQFHYMRLDDSANTQRLDENLNAVIEKYNASKFEYQLPDEYRLDEQLKNYCASLGIESASIDTEHFYTTRDELANFFKGKKQLVMEYFYRYMRKKHHIMIIGENNPEGGQWNYDKSNRKKWTGKPAIPEAKGIDKDFSEIVKMIEKAGVNTLGTIDPTRFTWPVSREESLEVLQFFCDSLLAHFGDYQDAMSTDEAFLFHSRLSFALNCKMITPKEVIEKVIDHWHEHEEEIHISQVEGFVRQIVGWREYMRGMYWKLMPDFGTKNILQNTNSLPEFYWTGKTKMNCLKHSIGQSLDLAYAHHIQRLMITGNFALLTFCHPDEVDAWYLGIYIDAIEWVEITNTRGMSQWADGGIIATKPYISSGSYINKMSDYCQNCHYSVSKKTGENACPFNSLYWNFLDEKRSKLIENRRMRMMYSVLDKMDKQTLLAHKERANHIINNSDEY